MPKVTIVLEDTDSGMTIEGNFEQPGVPFDEMLNNPTRSVEAGMMVIRLLAALSGEVTGGGSDDDGSPLSLETLLNR